MLRKALETCFSSADELTKEEDSREARVNKVLTIILLIFYGLRGGGRRNGGTGPCVSSYGKPKSTEKHHPIPHKLYI